MSSTTLKRSRSASPPFSPEKRSSLKVYSPAEPVRFLLISDTHSHQLPSNLPECDVLLHCGDMTEDGSPESIFEAIQAIASIQAELKLVIAGNHEISLDKNYYLGEGGNENDFERAQNVASAASENGVTFLDEGTHTFTLSSGATFTIYASPYTPQYGASAFQYATNEDRFNPPQTTPPWAKNVASSTTKIPDIVDIIMTHGPPKYILDATADGRSAGCEHLRRVLDRVRPKLHCFGHIHSAYGAQRLRFEDEASSQEESDMIVPLAKEFVGKNQSKKKGYASLPPGSLEAFRASKQTLCVNAAMEGKDGVLENAPWVIDMDLRIASEYRLSLKMTTTSLVLYRPGTSASLSQSASPTSLISSRLFSQQTGTAIATELLYRILFDIINRFLSSFQRLASKGMEEATSWIEQKMQERRDRLAAAKSSGGAELKIVEEVGKMAEGNGFVKCPMGSKGDGPTPPPWVQSVLVGIEEGRMQARDFYTNQW
ncbi:Metallo-dependent phosphatase-like protein [Paraphoma chrysanthemicola]|uniref:Metallo-dependent phosphatase-like protein n=1 Tax=Paraphoma chrysanthemicola TaxID=798071 RepID=A0A8K0VV07_9PLEO|nr:Metallo-dependent phosphatase-like protein [Paraphoma chrysanthemicola]